MNQDIDSHKRHLAEQLLRDTEQSSLLRPNTWLLVAKRPAKITGDNRVAAWLDAELLGCDKPDSDPLQIEYAARTGRLLDSKTGMGERWPPCRPPHRRRGPTG